MSNMNETDLKDNICNVSANKKTLFTSIFLIKVGVYKTCFCDIQQYLYPRMSVKDGRRPQYGWPMKWGQGVSQMYPVIH